VDRDITIQESVDKLFEEAFLLHLHKVRHYAFSYLKDNDAAECVAQDVFYALWINRDKVSFHPGILPYLLTITKNKCLNILKKENNKKKYEKFKVKECQSHINYLSLNDISSTNIYSHEVEKIYLKCIEEMPEKTKSTFLLSRTNKFSNEEIAKIQSVSIKTVESRITVSIKLLKEALKDYLIFIIGYFIC
jgi:RNA polymerase sigma-70 factor, ECF subfamily